MAARALVTELTGFVPESVSGLQWDGESWLVTVDVCELERIPTTTDVMATYVVQLDQGGGLLDTSEPVASSAATPRRTERMEGSPQTAPPAGFPVARRGDANLADILERVLDKGIVIAGDIQINLLDIELLTIKLRLLIASVDRAREMGINWWESDSSLQPARRRRGDRARPARAGEPRAARADRAARAPDRRPAGERVR